MKKTVIILFLGSVLAGVILLLGLTWVFGAIAESGVKKFAEGEAARPPYKEAWLNWEFDFADYQRGFFSSETSSHMKLAARTDEANETITDEGAPLRHRVYHGPLAMTPDGPKFCSYHIVTTVRLEDLPPKTQANIEKGFGSAEPVTFYTTVGFGGTQATRIKVAPFSVDDKESGTVSFGGAFADLETGRDLAFARGKFEIKATTASNPEAQEIQTKILPVTGNLDFVRDKHFHAHFEAGGAKTSMPDAAFTMALSTGEIDWIAGTHLKAQLTLGSIDGAGTNGQDRFNIGDGTASVDFKPVSDSFDLFLGEARLHLGSFEGVSNGDDIAVENLTLHFDSGEKEGKLYALLEYEIGSITASKIAASPMPVETVLGKGMKTELGVEGIDLATMESLIEKGAELPGFESVTSLSDYSKPEVLEAWSEAMAGNSEVLGDYTRTMLGVIQPGLEVHFTTTLRGAEGDSGFDIRLGMGGEKKLTDMKTPREILAAIRGDAIARLSKRQFPPEMFQALIANGPAAAFIAEHPNHFEAKGELQGGNLYVNGEAIPLLKSLGPEMDEPIDWEAMFKAETPGE